MTIIKRPKQTEKSRALLQPAPKLNFKGHKKRKTANYRAEKYGSVRRGEKSIQVTESTCHQLNKATKEKSKWLSSSGSEEKDFMNANECAVVT